MTSPRSSADQRVLFLASTAKDGATTQAMLVPLGVPLDVCRQFEDLVASVPHGAGALLLPEESMTPDNLQQLLSVLSAQPTWSDLPILVLTRQGADSMEAAEAARTLGNVTLLERPVRIATLVSALRTALRARDRQYQIREHLAERMRNEESLRIADRRKDEFLATLGHELRNPLAPLVTALGLLKSRDLQDPVVTRVTSVLDRQVNYLVRLVDDLLEVSRITRGQIEVHREPLDLASVLQSAIDTSRPALDAAGHTLRVELPTEPITLYGDSVRLTQVFANLLTNAAKYTNASGLIWIHARQDGQRAEISVRDDGIGIAPEQLQSVFDMFTQVDRSSRRSQGGLGIGLTLVRSLVQMHGGTVVARSAGLNQGSEFVVMLPVVAERAPLRRPTASMPAFPKRRILIVDDNRDAAETLGELLTALGATISVVHSGRAALAILDEFKPDVVLLDIGMPAMDGYEVARQIRRHSRYRQIMLIALTGWSQEHDQKKARKAGFDHHVVKPPDLERLHHILMAS